MRLLFEYPVAHARQAEFRYAHNTDALYEKVILTGFDTESQGRIYLDLMPIVVRH